MPPMLPPAIKSFLLIEPNCDFFPHVARAWRLDNGQLAISYPYPFFPMATMQLPNQHSTLLKRSTHEAVFLASSMIDRSAEAARVTLEEAEKQAATPLLRQQLADAMVALARHRARMRTQFLARIETAITHALDALKDIDLNMTARPSNLASLESVTLMAEAEVTQFVETSRLQQTVLPVVEDKLTRLDTLMSICI